MMNDGIIAYRRRRIKIFLQLIFYFLSKCIKTTAFIAQGHLLRNIMKISVFLFHILQNSSLFCFFNQNSKNGPKEMDICVILCYNIKYMKTQSEVIYYGNYQ